MSVRNENVPHGGQPVIATRGLRMRYGPKEVLRGVDLDAYRGEVLALLGPNGAGKTTTIEILEGFRRRSAGEVRVLGTDPDHGDEAWRARLGVVLQSWRDTAGGGSGNSSPTWAGSIRRTPHPSGVGPTTRTSCSPSSG